MVEVMDKTEKSIGEVAFVYTLEFFYFSFKLGSKVTACWDKDRKVKSGCIALLYYD